MALYNISFEVTRDAVTPSVPQRGGTYGDREQTVVTFRPTFTGATNYQYRVEVTDGAGGYDMTGLMLLKNGVVTLTVPPTWAVPGIAALRLVAVELDDDLNEAEVFHSPPAYLYFEDRDSGDRLWTATEGAWQAVMAKALGVAEAAEATAAKANEVADNADDIAETAKQHAEQAAEDAEAARQNAAAASETAKMARSYAEKAQALTASAEIAADKAAEKAEPYAVRAEAAAETAAGQAADCAAVLAAVQELSGIAGDIEEMAGEDGGIYHPCVTVDTALDAASRNPVTNAAITDALNGKAELSHRHTAGDISAGTGYWWGDSDTVDDALQSVSDELSRVWDGIPGHAAMIATEQPGGIVEDSLEGLWATKADKVDMIAESIAFSYGSTINNVADALTLILGKLGV